MAMVAVAVSVGLSRIAKQRLIDAKLHGAEMVVDNMAQALAPALDFSDSAAVTEYAERLSATRDVSQVILWNQQSSQPVFSKRAATLVPSAAKDENRIEQSQIVLTRLLKTPMGGEVGRLEAHFSLTPENRSFRQLRAKIVFLTAELAIVVAAIVIVIARYSVVLRLKQLLAAMVQLRNGQTVAVDASAVDEIGELALGFNEMAHAIRDCERKLSIERDI
jgi:methyl-accepting chemotaxis protein